MEKKLRLGLVWGQRSGAMEAQIATANFGEFLFFHALRCIGDNRGMSWEGFMQMERRQLRERRQGKLRRALGVVLPGESVEELDRLGEQDRLRAEQGLVAVMGKDGEIFYKYIDDLSTHDLLFRTAAERVEVAWLKERLARSKSGADSPTIPYHLG